MADTVENNEKSANRFLWAIIWITPIIFKFGYWSWVNWTLRDFEGIGPPNYPLYFFVAFPLSLPYMLLAQVYSRRARHFGAAIAFSIMVAMEIRTNHAISVSESSTAGIAIIFLPFYQLLVVMVFFAVAVFLEQFTKEKELRETEEKGE